MKLGVEPFASINRRLAEIRVLLNSKPADDPTAFFRFSGFHLWRIRLEEALLPLFEQAVRDRSITAWVGENDRPRSSPSRICAGKRSLFPARCRCSVSMIRPMRSAFRLPASISMFLRWCTPCSITCSCPGECVAAATRALLKFRGFSSNVRQAGRRRRRSRNETNARKRRGMPMFIW